MKTPYMPQQEIVIMDALFHLLKPRRVLEFGAGWSTARWSNPTCEWIAIETDGDWAERIAKAAPHADVILVDDGEFVKYAAPVLSDYDDKNPDYARRFDLIFVDGLYRTECVTASRKWLRPGGVVVLHDALRTEYKDAWDIYPHKVMLGEGNILHNGILLLWGGV